MNQKREVTLGREITLGNTWRANRPWNLTRPQLMFISALTVGAAIGLSVSANRKG